MKKSILTIILVFLTGFIYAQNIFNPSGNAGVGTTNPISDFQVSGLTILSNPVGGNYNENLRLPPSGANDYASIALGAVPGTSGSGPGQWSFVRYPAANNNLFGIRYSNNADCFNITNAGHVGIGTTSPNSTLDIHGYISVGGGSGNLDANGTAGSLSYLANSGQMVMGWNRTQGAGEADFISNQSAGGAGGFAFYNHDNSNNETQLMWVMGNGQVLIGNTQGKQGNYLLAVAGSAVATSFTVKTVTNWPDYVFKPRYHLQSLAYIKSYIDQNHHLPDMPSEKEVAEKGIDIGEVAKLQTKKIEELTLYLIEKDKQVKSQQQQIDTQQQVNTQQENRLNILENEIEEMKKQLNKTAKQSNKQK